MGLDALKEAVNCNAYAEAVVVNSSDSEDAVVKALRKAMDAGRIVIVNVFRHELKEKGWVSSIYLFKWASRLSLSLYIYTENLHNLDYLGAFLVSRSRRRMTRSH